MAISVDWPTGVITIPFVDLTPISGNRYSFDVLQFHLDLRTAHATEEGGVYIKTHDHQQDSELAGVTYADQVKILSPYTVEFEDMQIQVVLEGANHNLSDVQVTNQVGLITQNSAGLIRVGVGSVADIQAAVWGDSLTYSEGEKGDMVNRLFTFFAMGLGSPRVDGPTSVTVGGMTFTVSQAGDNVTTERTT